VARHGTQCTEWECGWLCKVPRVQNGIVDGLERCEVPALKKDG
jgi:hypothetical protein